MSVTVGVREFREDLASYIDQAETVTVTRHGEPVGFFVPVVRDRKAEILAAVEATRRVQAMLEERGISEDEIVAEIDAMRRAERAGGMAQ